MEFITKNAKETQTIAKKLLERIARKESMGASVVGLVGELGTGKTTFVQDLAQALGIKERVLSPTFVILKRFAISDQRFADLYHIDCYRLDKSEELEALGFSEILKNKKNIVLIEWAEKAKAVLPKDTVWIEFEHLGENKRLIKINE